MEYKDLSIKDDFVFGKVMINIPILKEFIRRVIPELNLDNVNLVITQRTINNKYRSHGVRLDVYAESNELLFVVEMQMSHEKEVLLKRTAYYQCITAIDNLDKGETYRDLKSIFVIFVCDFDPFDDKLYLYTLRDTIIETGKQVDMGRTAIYLNLKGEKGNISDELKNVINYFNDDELSDDTYVESMDEEVIRVKENEEYMEEYMGYICRIDDALITGRQQGKEEGILQGKEEGGNQKEKEMIKRLFEYCLGEGKNYEESYSYISKVYGYSKTRIAELLNK